MEDEIAKIEVALRNAFAGLPVHSIELLVNTPTEWVDISQPHRYRWIDGKLYSVAYNSGEIGKAVFTEVAKDDSVGES